MRLVIIRHLHWILLNFVFQSFTFRQASGSCPATLLLTHLILISSLLIRLLIILCVDFVASNMVLDLDLYLYSHNFHPR